LYYYCVDILATAAAIVRSLSLSLLEGNRGLQGVRLGTARQPSNNLVCTCSDTFPVRRTV